MKKSLAVLGACLTMSMAVHAQSTYVEMAYQTLDSGWATDPAVLRVTAGYALHPNFAIEGMLGMNFKKGRETLNGYSASVKVDNMAGVYLRSKYSLSDSMELYGRLGYARLKATAAVLSYRASDSDSDVSYGVGMAYSFDKRTHIFGDYMKVADTDAIAFGVGFKF